MSALERAASVEDLRRIARGRLPRMLFEYIDGGSYDEVTLKRNVEDLRRLSLRQRVLRDMSRLDLTVRLFDQDFAMPIGLAPVGMAGMYARRGEAQAARAACAAGVPFCLSTMGICTLEEVANRCRVPPWFQLYVLKDRGYMRELLARAYAGGCPVLMLTVDLPVPGARYRDVRSGFRGLAGLPAVLNQLRDGLSHPGWLWDVWLRGRPHALGSIAAAVGGGGSPSDFLNWIAGNFDRSVSWKDLDWIRAQWNRPLVLKGVLDAEDAQAALHMGVQGLVVSNHGGRQLDGVRSSVSALPAIVERVGSDLTVFMDGGIRSGLDVLKALSLGARACFVGRAWAYALGAGAERGVAQLLATLREELEVAMILTGCTSLRQAGRELLESPRNGPE